MAQGKLEILWLKLLGGKPEHAGLGVMTIGLVVTAIGGLVAFLGSNAGQVGTTYWAGYSICVVGFLCGACGIIYHRILSQRAAGSQRNDA